MTESTRVVLMLVGAAALGLCQTKVNLTNQSRNVDFSSFPATRPWKVSASLPATCLQGEGLFLTTANPGQQLLVCSSPNVWLASSAAPFLELQAVKTASNVLTVGPSCASANPCRVRFGNKLFSLPDPATLTLSGVPGSGTIYVWVDEQGLTAGHSGVGVLTCNESCDVVDGSVTGFPMRSVPLAAVTYAGNVLDPVSGAMDMRTILSGQHVEPGASANVTVINNGVTGASEVDLSSTLDFGGFVATRVLRRGTLAQRPSGCAVGDLYHQTDNSAGIYECVVAGQWRGPLASLDSVAAVQSRLTVTGQSGNAAPVTVLSSGHTAGWYRVCAAAAVTSGGTGTLDLALSWRSPVQGTDLTATLASIAVTAPIEGWGCRIIRSTGAVGVTVDPSDAGAAQYDMLITAERLQ